MLKAGALFACTRPDADIRPARVSVDLDAERGARHPEKMETTIYRVAQEAISNAIKHAGTDRVAVELHADDVRMTVRVRDRGRGFDPAASTTGFGLLGMRERVEELGGRLILESAPGKGVTVTAALPASPRVSGLRRSGWGHAPG